MGSKKAHQEADERFIESRDKGKMIQFNPRALNITWGNDDRYWRISESAAELLQVSWLEVTCSTKKDSVEYGKTYSVGFNVSLKADAFGWDGIDVYVMAKIGKMGKFIYEKVSLVNGNDFELKDKNPITTIPKQPLKIKVDNKDDKSIYLGLYEVWTEKWKGGLKIHNAFVRHLDA